MLLDTSKAITQERFAELVGISQQAVSELVSRETLPRNGSARQWLQAYCANLREQAAGRAASGDLALVGERARLASEQANRIAMQNAVTRKELAPVAVITEALARVGNEIVGILEALPIQLKRRSLSLTTQDLEFITEEITRARNTAAAIEVNLDDLEDAGNPERDPRRAETV